MKVKQDLKDNLDKMRDYFNKLRADDIDQDEGFKVVGESLSVCLFCHLAVCFDLKYCDDDDPEKVVYGYKSSFEKSDYWEDFRELIYDSIMADEDFRLLYNRPGNKGINPGQGSIFITYFYRQKAKDGKGLGEFLFNAVKDRLQVLKSKRYGWEF